MPGMTKNPKIGVALNPEMRAALEAYCAQHDLEVAALVRDAALREIGREDLIQTMSRGRPKLEPEPPPVKKPRRKRV